MTGLIILAASVIAALLATEVSRAHRRQPLFRSRERPMDSWRKNDTEDGN